MAVQAHCSDHESDLGRFLYAQIGQLDNGTPLTILSALAQLGLDPWREAARLAQLPKDEAARELAFLFARLPKRAALVDRRTIGIWSAELLPGPAAAASARPRGAWTTAALCAVLGVALLTEPLLTSALLGGWLATGTPRPPASASLEPFPSRPIALIVIPSQAGLDDGTARLLSDRLGGVLGQPVNGVAYAGVEARRLVAQAEPDGHTLLMIDAAAALDPAAAEAAALDLKRDLQPVALVGTAPLALVVPGTSPFSTVGDLLAASRASSIGLAAVPARPGTLEAFGHEMLRSSSPLRLADGPHGGSGTLDDLLVGRADACLCSLPAVLPHIASGALRITAVSSAKRTLALPHVPTLMEELKTGAPEIAHWIGIFAPSGTPSIVTGQINHAVNRILGQPEVRERLLGLGIDLRPMSADAFERFVDAERQKYAQLRIEALCSRNPLAGCSRRPFQP